MKAAAITGIVIAGTFLSILSSGSISSGLTYGCLLSLIGLGAYALMGPVTKE